MSSSFSPMNSERLYLRPFTRDDGALLHRLMANPKVFFWLDAPVPMEDAQSLLESKVGNIGAGLGWWPVFLKSSTGEDSGFLGQVCAQPLPGSEEIELGYHFLPHAWGNGFATEAAMTLLKLFFTTTENDRISAVVLPDNHPSLGVVVKLGFELCGKRLHGKKPRLHHYFELSRSRFDAHRAIASASP